ARDEGRRVDACRIARARGVAPRAAAFLDLDGREIRLGHQLTLDRRLAVHLPQRPVPAHVTDLDAQLVAGYDLAAKLGVLDAGQDQQHALRLGEALLDAAADR